MTTMNSSRILRIIPLLLIVVLFCTFSYGKVIYVNRDGQPDFDNIQAGIDAAVDGDTVLVAPGEYVITEPITFRGKAITLTSEAGRDETTIRMGTPANTNRGSVMVFENKETDMSVLEGFTITGGKGFWFPSAYEWGGGGILFNASCGIVRNCVVVQNSTGVGGGVFVYTGSSATLTNCIITDNSARLLGGGVVSARDSLLTMTDCIISGNTTTNSGGGAVCWYDGSLILTNCTVRDNSAENSGGGLVRGGGQNSSITMTDCAIMNNTARKQGGGGMDLADGFGTLTNCIIAQNMGGLWGGGLLCVEPSSSTTIINCTIYGNSAGNDGGGLGCYNGASATLTNSIIWGNTAPNGQAIYLEQSPTTFSISYSDVSAGQTSISVEGGSDLSWGEGNIDANPLFGELGHWSDINDPNIVVEPNDPNAIWIDGDYHLKSKAGRWDPISESWIVDDVTSPCIDAGDPNSEVGGEPEPNGGRINMGAYGGTVEASKSPTGKSIYIFMPEESMVIQTGGIAGVNWTYTLTGQFQLTVDYGTGKAWLSDVDATATDNSEPTRMLDPNEAFNLTGLMGTISQDGSIEFAGRTADGSDVLLVLTLSDEWISLKGQTSPPPNSADFFIFNLDAVAQRNYGGGTGEQNDPYLIYTAGQMNALGTEPNDWDKHFKLMADINLSGYSYDAALIAQDIDSNDPAFQGTSFTGVFDGGGHAISNFTITGESYLGLFGRTEYEAEIKNLSIIDVNITGTDYVGGLVGFNNGSITTSRIAGLINGNNRVGGLAGRNWGSINASLNEAAVTGYNDVGGLTAGNYGTINNSYNTGAVSSNSDVGGLAGENYGAINKCYSTAPVSGERNFGGFVGFNWESAIITSSFWDVETSGQATSTGGTGKTTSEMQAASTFLEAGWDFVGEITNGTENIWRILEGQDYPRLWWEASE